MYFVTIPNFFHYTNRISYNQLHVFNGTHKKKLMRLRAFSALLSGRRNAAPWKQSCYLMSRTALPTVLPPQYPDELETVLSSVKIPQRIGTGYNGFAKATILSSQK